ncbi:MAG: regulatory protein RecX [Gammaproteobacteria bacterium]|nr:MAG: regulatory protein RecX [Gammaproteobacteria bacterium]
MDNLTLIRRAALALLARRDYSQHEVLQKLKTKGFSSDDIHLIINHLLQAGLINEQRLIDNYLHFRRAKGYGPQRICMELQARGLTEEMIAERLQITDNAWFTEAQKVWQKQFKGRLPTDYPTRAKQMRFLQYRGFTREQIEQVFRDKGRLSDD